MTRWAPWPPTSGARHRSANVIAALSELGEVDVFLLADPTIDREFAAPPDARVARVGAASRTPVEVRRADRAMTALPWMRPARIRRLETASARAAFREWEPGRHDFTWMVRIESWLTLGDLVDAPTVIDFDDLQDGLLLSRSRSTWPGDPTGSRRSLRLPLGRWANAADAAAWRRLQRRVASAVAAVTVCSEPDRNRLAVDNGAVVINGVELPERLSRHPDVGIVPTICLHGSLNYRPNTEAAEVLVRDILPVVRRRVPNAVVRLVGRHDARVANLADPPRVVVTGLVPDITAELAQADVVAVPLREGAGTRVKVLEALAHRVPVVATTIAVEGLDVEHGRHLLVADDPASFAAACGDLLEDVELRRSLADAGHQLVRDRYLQQHARRAVADLARSVVRRGR